MWDDPRNPRQGYPEWERQPNQGRTGNEPPYYPPNGPPDQGSPNYGSQWGNEPTDPSPPTYHPAGPQYPGGHPPSTPPQWNRPPAPQPRQPGTYPGNAGGYGQEMAPEHYHPVRVADHPQKREEPTRRAGVRLPHLPIAHIFLILGVGAMAYAITQPWGVAASGTDVYVRDFGSARLAASGIDAGTIAVRVATGIVIAAGIMGAVLILLNSVVTILNHILGIVGLSGCASLAFFPVLWGAATLLFVVLLAGAGFAGLGALNQLPVVRDYGFTIVDVQHSALGYYLWAGGLIVTFVGMLGQLVLRRR